MEMGMFSAEGNSKVSAIVTRVVGLELQDDAAWKYAYRELDALSELAGTEEATDTEVREALWEELLKRNVIVEPDTVDYWFYIEEPVF
jgi:transcription elongation GreA/GreB family factor